MNRFQGKTAIITGASSGIGACTAKTLAKEGCNLVLAARNTEKLKAAAEACAAEGVEVLPVCADVSRQEDCCRLAETAASHFGAIDILVNNAGIADKHRPIDRLETDWYRHVLEINQNSVFYMMQAVLPHMKDAGKGAIVNISSIGAVRSNSGLAYTTAKTAVIGMSKNVALEFAPGNIRVNVVCPGPTPTALNTPDQIATFDADFAAQCNSHMALDDVPQCTVQDQANAICFLASDEAAGITGQVLTVDHGMTI
ncbi:MAG: SDR family NAD(P)-dependent oxidoreductase [Oscillospiraceae bacterium]|nr:SDR family NAD(P)-dependent oxidoreductase [Oscillospiraceae bacterium]